MRKLIWSLPVVILTAACGSDTLTGPSSPTPNPVTVAHTSATVQPTPAATPTPEEGYVMLLQQPGGFGRVVVTNNHPDGQNLTVVWTRDTQLGGRFISDKQTQFVPAWSTVVFWPSCFFSRQYQIRLAGKSIYWDHYFRPGIDGPTVGIAVTQDGFDGVCYRNEVPY